jgi:hypothetical protein
VCSNSGETLLMRVLSLPVYYPYDFDSPSPVRDGSANIFLYDVLEAIASRATAATPDSAGEGAGDEKPRKRQRK